MCNTNNRKDAGEKCSKRMAFINHAGGSVSLLLVSQAFFFPRGFPQKAQHVCSASNFRESERVHIIYIYAEETHMHEDISEEEKGTGRQTRGAFPLLCGAAPRPLQASIEFFVAVEEFSRAASCIHATSCQAVHVGGTQGGVQNQGTAGQSRHSYTKESLMSAARPRLHHAIRPRSHDEHARGGSVQAVQNFALWHIDGVVYTSLRPLHFFG